MDKITWLFNILLVFYAILQNTNVSSGIELAGNITEKVVVIENGTVDDVILDCPYILDEDDKPGLVIKWFYDGDSHPIFQWIPEGQNPKPQLIAMEDMIDADHTINDDNHHKHRALRLVSPTTEVHGLYTCEVSSHFDEKKVDVNLIVYSLPSALTLTVNETDSENVTVTCVSEPAFPEPELEITLMVADTRTPIETESETTWDMGLYSTTLTAVVDADTVSAAPVVEFLCTLTIPHTELSVTEGLKYRSDGLPIYDEDGVETSTEDINEDLTYKLGASTHRNSGVRANAASPLPLIGMIALSVLLAGQ